GSVCRQQRGPTGIGDHKCGRRSRPQIDELDLVVGNAVAQQRELEPVDIPGVVKRQAGQLRNDGQIVEVARGGCGIVVFRGVGCVQDVEIQRVDCRIQVGLDVQAVIRAGAQVSGAQVKCDGATDRVRSNEWAQDAIVQTANLCT